MRIRVEEVVKRMIGKRRGRVTRIALLLGVLLIGIGICEVQAEESAAQEEYTSEYNAAGWSPQEDEEVTQEKLIESGVDVRGRAVRQGWIQDAQGWWYQNSDGTWPSTSWRRIDGQWYYFNASGYWVNNNTYERMNPIKGIDVSKWQGSIDWNKVKGDWVQFAFLRVGHGTREIDSTFKANAQNAVAAGIPIGVYYYSEATSVTQAIEDAQFVINSIKGYKISYPVVIDIEDSIQIGLGKNAVSNMINAFCNEIKSAGYYPMLYCNENWYKNYINTSMVTGIDKWVARYNYVYDTNIPRSVWQACSTGRVNGISGNVDVNFANKDFTRIITPRTQPVAGYIPTGGQWIQDDTGWWYQRKDGSYPKNQWEFIARKWYHFDASGYMQTGWIIDSKKYYYLDSSGAMQTGLITVDGKTYYCDSSGVRKSGWIQISGKWRYFSGAGEMTTGWQKVSGQWYYMNGQGIMQTGWQMLSGKWYYMNSSGVRVTGWQFTGGKWYYMNSSGIMLTGWQKSDGQYYYLSGSGAMLTGWQKLSGKWYFMNGSGARVVGWQFTGNQWYYMNGSGVMLIGWQKSGGQYYYLSGSGAMLTGWQKLSGKWYYMNSSGVRVTGWLFTGGRWYYMNSSGIMLANTSAVINKKTYRFASSGACLNP